MQNSLNNGHKFYRQQILPSSPKACIDLVIEPKNSFIEKKKSNVLVKNINVKPFPDNIPEVQNIPYYSKMVKRDDKFYLDNAAKENEFAPLKK